MQKKKGILVLIGGAEKRTGRKGLLRKIVSISKAETIALIPTASKYPREVARNYRAAFRDLGVKRIHVLDIRSRRDADRTTHLERLEESGVIFFSGGDQVRLVDTLGATSFIETVHRKFNEGTMIAGTSAGAAAASDPMIYDGQDRGLLKGRVRSAPGFGFLKGITVDTHFTVRNRIPRLAQFLVSGLSRRGIGLSENTALFVTPKGIAEVAGSGSVTLLSSDARTFSNYDAVDWDAPISAQGLKLGYLSPGILFNLNRWSVQSRKSLSNRLVS